MVLPGTIRSDHTKKLCCPMIGEYNSQNSDKKVNAEKKNSYVQKKIT